MTAVDILAIAAHPDDAEIGCGGALLIAAEAGLRTGVLDLTMGESSTRGTVAERERERDRATALLGLAVRSSLGLPDGAVGISPDHRLALVAALRQHRPRIVLAPYPHDRHPDHAAAGRLAGEACFFARVAKLGEGAAHGVNRLYHYMLHHRFTPSFVVDVSPVWDLKMAAISTYRSQFEAAPGPETEISDGAFLRYVEARAIVDGAMVGARFGEPYHHAGPIRVDGLPDGAHAVEGMRPYSMYY